MGDWYDIKAPSVFKVRQVGKTLVNRTAGTKIASEGLKGRVFEVSLADLQNENDAERSYRKFKLICEDVQAKNCLTSFYGMNLTTDKLRSMVKKWQTLVEGNVDVKTTDGYMLRLFCIGFTRKQDQSTKKTCYAQSAQVKNIRKKMVDIITREVSTTDLKEVVNKLIPDSIARDIEKACQGIYPLHDVHQKSEGHEEAQVRPDQADGHARRGQRQDRGHHQPRDRRGCREGRGIRAPNPGVRVTCL